MDNLRGQFTLTDIEDELDEAEYGYADEDIGREVPPSPIGQDERRMQVRAYNHWASLLADRNFPSIEDLEPAELPDFGPYSVLLDFTNGLDDPAVRFLGGSLAQECDAPVGITRLSDVPPRSLLTRITDHYMQILANQAPIGFEAEFVNQRGSTILYRGILLPFSSDDDTIDFIYGVINWKELADQLTSDELLLEIDQALETQKPRAHGAAPTPEWADGPLNPTETAMNHDAPLAPHSDDPFPLPSFGVEMADEPADTFDLSAYELAGFKDDEESEEEDADLYEAIEAVDEEPEGSSRFASLLSLGGSGVPALSLDEEEDEDGGDDGDEIDPVAKWLKRPVNLDQPMPPVSDAIDTDEAVEHAVGSSFEPMPLDAFVNDEDHALAHPVEAIAAPVAPETVHPAVEDTNTGADLHDVLAVARELALAARNSEDRSRGALYAAVGRAYDVSLAAAEQPDEFAELLEDSGLTVQDRAPMTPVVKLVFGADYDKTRIAEYASVLGHAHRQQVARGALADYLGRYDGGLKGVVQAERHAKRQDAGLVKVRETPSQALARKLRKIAPLGFEDIATEGEEFALVLVRRDGGNVVVLGEIADPALIERAGRRLVA